MRRLICLIILVALMMIAVSPVAAQSNQEIPRYVRYCDLSFSELLTNGMSLAENQLVAVDDVLSRFDDGFVTYLEGVTLAGDALNTWQSAEQIECLTALNADVERVLASLTIAMLLGQINDVTRSNTFLQIARDTMVTIRTDTQAAIAYLENPPATPTDIPEVPATTARTPDEMETELSDFLLANGITLLREVTIDAGLDGLALTVRIDSLPDFDEANVLFTFDTVAEVVRDWEELSQITRFIVEVYSDDVTRVLYVESSSMNFVAYYYDQTFTKEQFEAALTRFGQ